MYINDVAAGTAGCQHIRITFFKSTSKLHYQAFSQNNYKCGWIEYAAFAQAESGGGPAGGFFGA